MNSIALPASNRLETRDLRLIVALATTQTTAAAAKRLHLTQPAVSRALLGLEQRLHTSLFDRTPKGLKLTPAGHTLLQSAPRLLDELSLLESQVRGLTAPAARQHLRLVCECYTAYHWLPSTLRALQDTLPGVELSIALEHTADPIGALLAGELDVALISEAPTPRSRRIETKPLFFDEVLFVMSASHPLASRRSLTRGDLQKQRLFTSRAPTRDMRWFPREMLASKQDEPPLDFRVIPLTETIMDFVRAGLGVGVLSEWLARPHLQRDAVVARRLASGPIRRPWRLLWRKEVEHTALQLLNALNNTG